MFIRDRFPTVLALTALVILLIVSGCAPAESALAVSEPWARAASAGMPMDSMSEQSDDASAMTNNEDADGENTMTDSEGDEMPSGTMSGHSGAVSAAYMIISNTGAAADRLISASTDAAAVVEIHTVEMENDVMRMRPLTDGLEIPAGESVSLQPGGFHIMLMDLQQDLIAGETLQLTLGFESGKEVTIEAEIRTP